MYSVSLFLLLAMDWETFVVASSGSHAFTDVLKSDCAERETEQLLRSSVFLFRLVNHANIYERAYVRTMLKLGLNTD